jgi:hypothetical protein
MLTAAAPTGHWEASPGSAGPIGSRWSTRAYAAGSAPGSSWKTWPVLTPWTTGPTTAGTTSRLKALVNRDELPFVVMGSALVDADRGFFAFADDAHHAADASRKRRARLLRSLSPPTGQLGLTPARRLTPSTWGILNTRLRRLNASRRNDDKFAILHHRIFELLSKESLLHQYVDARRIHARAILPLIQRNGLRVLLAAEDQFHFLLALRLMAPHWQRCGHQDRHHPETDQQRRHRISALAALTL